MVASVSFTGYRLGTGLEASTEDPASTAVTEEASAPQAENGVETAQSEQTAGDLKITAEGAPVDVCLTSDSQYRYEYDKDEYAVTTTTNGSTLEIKVTDIRPGADIGDENMIIYIPNQSYGLITIVSEGSSLILPAIDADITVTSNASSMMLSLPSGYDKTLNYTGNASSCSLSMGDVNDVAVSARITTSAVLVPSIWPVYDMLSPDYRYTSGNGTAKINIDITSSSFTFE